MRRSGDIMNVFVNPTLTGYVLAEDVYSRSGKLLLAKGTQLTKGNIKGLLRYQVKQIYVYTQPNYNFRPYSHG